MPVARKLRADRNGAETKSFCPCQKRETSACLSLFFRSDWGRNLGTGRVSWGAGRLWRPSSADRGGSRDKSFCPCHKTGGNSGFLPVFFLHVLHGFGVHLGSDTGFSHLVLSVPNRSHPLQHPKRTRLRLFSHEIGCVSLFLLVFGRKIFDIFFVHSADMVHKLKSLVIPLSREVSFLT